jgi:hypothetical protein
MFYLFVWIALCVVAGAIASSKGRSAVGFFFLALFRSPLGWPTGRGHRQAERGEGRRPTDGGWHAEEMPVLRGTGQA